MASTPTQVLNKKPSTKPEYPMDDAQKIKQNGPTPPVKKKPIKEAVKLCIKCNGSPPLSEFYKNNGWASQAFHDAWCKPCIKKYCINKETLREYCWYNNRAWNEGHWERSIQAAKYQLNLNQNYLKSNESKKAIMEEAVAVSAYTAKMNMAHIYTYSDNISPERGYYSEFSSGSNSGKLDETAQDELRIDNQTVYDERWNGLFTKRDLGYLNNYYRELENDFSLDDVSMRDYAMKVAKASLLHDVMYNKYRAGDATSKEYSDAKSNFDELSKSANFAACKRRVDEKTMVLPMSQVTQYLEANGKIMARKDMWEQDSIDQMILEMRHIATSLGRDGGSG